MMKVARSRHYTLYGLCGVNITNDFFCSKKQNRHICAHHLTNAAVLGFPAAQGSTRKFIFMLAVMVAVIFSKQNAHDNFRYREHPLYHPKINKNRQILIS
jgi:hypothetical protein